MVTQRGHTLLGDPAPTSASLDADIEWCVTQLAGQAWAWIVVDHYGLDARWERAVAPLAGQLLVIDDLADRPHDCDLLLDQNYLPDRARDYRSLVPSRCALLLGPAYALLRPEYGARRPTAPASAGRVRKLLVSFGGADPHRLTERSLEALSHPDFSAIDADVVCVTDPDRRSALEAAAARRGGVRILGSQEHLADLMASADVALGAGGATTWERLCVGLPALVITVAANQTRVTEVLARERLIVWLGSHNQVSVEAIRSALRRITSGVGWPDVSRGMAMCDGLGVERVMEAMDRVSPTPAHRERQ